MADFRKVILVLAVLAIVAAPASAQLACTAQASPAQIRAEGITELVGDSILKCTNDATRNVSIEAIIGSTNITNAIIDTPPTMVNAYVLITDATGTTGAPIEGRLTTPNSIIWQSVPIPVAVAPASLLIRITNIRVNASALGVGTGGVVTQVQETVLVSGTNVLDVPNNVLNVAAARTGLFFDVSEAEGSPFQACLGKSAPTGTTLVTPDFELTFTEGFGNAFKVQTLPTNPALPPNAEENVTFATLGITSGFVQGVTNGTQLRAVFSDVPAGVSVWVTTSALASSDITADLVAGTTATGAGGGYRRVVLTDGAGEAIWEVVPSITGPVAPDPAKIEDAVFGVLVSFSANVQLPPVTGLTAFSKVGGSFAPISDVFVAAELDEDDAPIPRFVDTATPEDTFQVVACVTNLLFPFVSNQAGFDTGIALVNTSYSNFTGSSGTPANQPFNTVAQTGTCTLYYFGVKSDGTTPAPQTTVPIGTATTSTVPINKYYEAFALSQGGPAGATGSAASFTGYIIARCNFQFGHGYAFITDLGAQKLAQGYLALVIPDRGSNVRKAENFTSGGTGEQLAN